MIKLVSALAKAASRKLFFPYTDTLEERTHSVVESQKALSEQVVRARETWLIELDTGQLRTWPLLDRGTVIDEGG
jgi:hypothetical protein